MINEILDHKSIWIMYCAENSDPYFKKFITGKTIVPSMAVLSHDKIFLLVHELDENNVKDFSGEVITYSSSIPSSLQKIIKNLNFPENIFLNFSDKLDFQTDVLGYGTFRFLHDNICSFYQSNTKSTPEFKSADNIIYELMDTKSEEDIKYLKIAANRALQILNSTFQKIKVGMTEKQIANLTQKIFMQKPNYFKFHGIVKEEFSWEQETCPIVLVGPNLKKGGHSEPSNTMLKPGYTVYFDFGVKFFLKSGKCYSSDIQRMGYALKPNERNAPPEVQKVFDTLKSAIELGKNACKPGVLGHEIDAIVRSQILNAGYPDYNHATGHPVGENAHSPGTSLSPKGHKRSALPLRENGVYTIEPRIQIENGGSIEEMIQVTKSGGITLCPPQQKLYLIR